MTGMYTLEKLYRIQAKLAMLGMQMTKSRFNGDSIAVCPSGDGLPVYHRESPLFEGSLEEIDIWLQGVSWARDYDWLLRISSEKKRHRKEDLWRQKKLVDILSSKEEQQNA